MKRVIVPELLDDDRGTPQQIQDSLTDLRMLNRYFGGTTTTTSLLLQVAERLRMTNVSWLDVAGASGDVAAAACKALASEGITLAVTVLDRSPGHLRAAPASAICGSAFQLPFADASFDVVGCNLFVHHLGPAEFEVFMAEAMRVCRRAVIINDLERTTWHWLAAHAGRLIYRSAVTRHDAPVSVRRAYTQSEVKNILQAAGYSAVESSHHFLYRMGFIVWRKAEE
ncbi:MAG TPA: methyltransferase domain-containing protein [Terriglobales bacterium]|nr:methyltransferase domain-containing protein [Terriglobales bacterium]